MDGASRATAEALEARLDRALSGERSEAREPLGVLADEFEAQGSSDPLVIALGDLARGIVFLLEDQADASIERCARARASFARLDRPRWFAVACRMLAGGLRARGRLAEARARLEEGLAAARRGGPVDHEARLLAALAVVCLDERRLDEAIEHGRAALVLFRRAGNPVGEAVVRVALGAALLRRGAVSEAADAFGQASAVFRERGMTVRLASCLVNMATTHLRAEDPAPAVGMVEEAITILRDGTQRTYAAALDCQSHVYLAVGRFDEALVAARGSLALRQAKGTTVECTYAHGAVAGAHLALGDAVASEAAARSGLALEDLPEAAGARGRCLLVLAKIRLEQVDFAAAADALRLCLLLAHPEDALLLAELHGLLAEALAGAGDESEACEQRAQQQRLRDLAERTRAGGVQA